ncbi:MAG: NifU N-terminal domain-containing protein [Gemmatimonadota bacterium]
MGELNVRVEGTPNPNAAKFVLDRRVLGEGSRSYFHSRDAEGDPLAERLFAIAGVRALFMVEDFITITKCEEADWSEIVEDARAAIRSELED